MRIDQAVCERRELLLWCRCQFLRNRSPNSKGRIPLEGGLSLLELYWVLLKDGAVIWTRSEVSGLFLPVICKSLCSHLPDPVVCHCNSSACGCQNTLQKMHCSGQSYFKSFNGSQCLWMRLAKSFTSRSLSTSQPHCPFAAEAVSPSLSELLAMPWMYCGLSCLKPGTCNWKRPLPAFFF